MTVPRESVRESIDRSERRFDELRNESERDNHSAKELAINHSRRASCALRLGLSYLLLAEVDAAESWFRTAAENSLAEHRARRRHKLDTLETPHWASEPVSLREAIHAAILSGDTATIADVAAVIDADLDSAYIEVHPEDPFGYYYLTVLVALFWDDDRQSEYLQRFLDRVAGYEDEQYEYFKPLAVVLRGLVEGDTERVRLGFELLHDYHESGFEAEPTAMSDYIDVESTALYVLARSSGVDVNVVDDYLPPTLPILPANPTAGSPLFERRKSSEPGIEDAEDSLVLPVETLRRRVATSREDDIEYVRERLAGEAEHPEYWYWLLSGAYYEIGVCESLLGNGSAALDAFATAIQPRITMIDLVRQRTGTPGTAGNMPGKADEPTEWERVLWFAAVARDDDRLTALAHRTLSMDSTFLEKHENDAAYYRAKLLAAIVTDVDEQTNYFRRLSEIAWRQLDRILLDVYGGFVETDADAVIDGVRRLVTHHHDVVGDLADKEELVNLPATALMALAHNRGISGDIEIDDKYVPTVLVGYDDSIT